MQGAKSGRKIRVCPNCQSAEVLPIMYGLPGPELLQEAKEGKVALGGCEITGDDPLWFCRSCGHRWRGRRR